MGRSLLNMNNEELYESSLRFIFKQLDIYVEVNKEANKRNKVKGYKNNSNSKEETKLKVLD
ncbi:MAG: hypothetical protein E6176_08865 [Clostridium celatum]|nr:hypothetical protein [Clostridium celatum]